MVGFDGAGARHGSLTLKADNRDLQSCPIHDLGTVSAFKKAPR